MKNKDKPAQKTNEDGRIQVPKERDHENEIPDKTERVDKKIEPTT